MIKIKTKTDISYLKIFLSFFKIGAVTFGGGYAMLSIIEDEVVDKLGIVDREEYYDFVSIAQSLPGPIAVNISLIVGNRAKGFWGSVAAMMGAVMPSFLIILIIAMFYGIFRDSKIVSGFFEGVAGVVPALLIVSFISMFKAVDKNILSMILFVLTTVAVVYFEISPILVILAGIGVGICIYYLKRS